MSVRNVGGTFETARKLVESGLTEYLQKVVPSDPAYLAPLFEHDFNYPLGLDDRGNGNGWPVEFENVSADPALVTARDGQRPWFKVMVVDNFSRQIAISGFGLSRSYLMGAIDIYVRQGTGVSRARAIADELNDWYKDLNPNSGRRQAVNLGLTEREWAAVQIRQPELGRVPSQPTEKWHRIRLQMEIEVDKKYLDVTT